MGRNELCFCGSGKKQKKCHPDIDDNSFAARVLRLYKQIDNDIKNHYQFTGNKYPCKEGCSECCYDYFLISDIEYDIILDHIKDWTEIELHELHNRTIESWEALKVNHPVLASNLQKDATGNSTVATNDIRFMIEKTTIPCPFLNTEDNRCKVYDVRPVICRSFGTGYQYNEQELIQLSATNNYVCSHLGTLREAMDWQASLIHFDDEISSLSNIAHRKYDYQITRRKYPILYFCYMSFVKYKEGTKIPNFTAKFRMTEDQFKEQLFQTSKSMGLN